MNQELMLAVMIISSFFAVIGFILGLIAVIKVLALEKSTHQIQYVPVDEEIERANEEYLAQTDQWATPSQIYETDDKKYKEELEGFGMTDFIPDEDDKKTRSF